MAEDGKEKREKREERKKEKIERCDREMRGATEERKLLEMQPNRRISLFIENLWPTFNKRCSNLPDGGSSGTSGMCLSKEATVPSKLVPGK